MNDSSIITLGRKCIFLLGYLLLLAGTAHARVITPGAAVIPAVNFITGVDTIGGTWLATIESSKIRIEFKSDAFKSSDDDHWWDSANFELSDFPNLPKVEKGTFSLTREAGTIAFTGKFGGNTGLGTYKFTANKQFKDYIENSGVTHLEESDEFAFFTCNLNKDYIEMLQRNGFKGVYAGNMAAMSSLKIDEPFIQQFSAFGYNDIPANQLIALKAKRINGDFIKGFTDIGYTNIPVNYLITFKSMNITPAFVYGFKKLGFTDIPPGDLQTLKSKGVTPQHVADMQQKGFKSANLRKYIQLKKTSGE
ncbi:MAG: hypothetical protein JWR09_4848 [Mucilaginibacter sp.]|nr:hypothetical protein [Mucilaginibacter sp.]